MYYNVKRSLDFFISLIGILITCPVLLLVSIFILVDSRGPIIFKQKRLGKNGKEFNIYKFRSMTVGAESKGSGQYSYSNDPRVTRVGKVIRATSIDELPQFFNIIKGEMSLIGPRPTLTYHPKKITEYSDFEKKRFLVRPGVTGWAQINGRKNVLWEDRFKFDVYYVENLSFKFDCIILITTIKNVILMKDNLNINKTR
ncbi:sugar transferase [Enterococcus sp. RIT-PI-f]|uniref:sugar transferase n=1 Tax=Enterococcus sp. RIT-PI-f TaxID=1690244 RepID=UPI000AAECCC6|nr:sugar transferase [Enterococcus sp. RIT-PI-f]